MEPFKMNNKVVYPIIFPINYGTMKSINCFLYDDGKTLTLIDGGINIPEFIQFFYETLNHYQLTVDDINQIYLTHHHEDHVGIINSILSEKTIPIYAHHLAISRLQYEESFLENKMRFFKKLYKEYGCSHYAGARFEKMEQTYRIRDRLKIKGEITPLYEGDMVGDLKVFEVPGHSPDSIIFYNEEIQWQFSGDLVLKNTSTNAILDFDGELSLLPTVTQYENSLQKCKEITSSWLFPGHQEPIQNHEVEIELKLERMKKKVARVVDAVAKGNHQTIDIARALYGNRVEKQFSLIISEVIGYLEYTVSKGLLEKEMINSQWNFRNIENEQ